MKIAKVKLVTVYNIAPAVNDPIVNTDKGGPHHLKVEMEFDGENLLAVPLTGDDKRTRIIPGANIVGMVADDGPSLAEVREKKEAEQKVKDDAARKVEADRIKEEAETKAAEEAKAKTEKDKKSGKK